MARYYAPNRILTTELPSIIHNPKIINQKTTGELICPRCGQTRRIIINRPTLNHLIKSNGMCHICVSKSRTFKLPVQLIQCLYEVKHLKISDIANKYRVSISAIRKCMKRNNIHIRNKGETRYILFQDSIQNKGTIKSPALGDIRVGRELGLHNVNYYLYVSCKQCNTKRWETKSRVKKHPLCKPCAMKLVGLNHHGEKASAWHGGISFEPYGVEFNNELREQIRQRDNYTCQLCGNPQNGKLLAVHHIDYNKRNNNPNNLISLCPTPANCHNKTTHHREYWTKYFNNLLKARGVLISTS